MRRYFAIVRVPGVARVLLSQLVARFPFGMLSIAFLVFAQRTYDSYAAAGAVLAAMSLGNAVAGPISARFIGVWGVRTVILSAATLVSATITVMVFVPMPVFVMAMLGCLAGAAYPPVQSAVRTLYPKMVDSQQLGALYSLDASAQEIIWIVGPVITTFISIQISDVLGVMLSVAFFIGGGLWFVTSPAVAKVKIPRNSSRFGAVLRNPVVSLNTFIGLLFVASFASAEASIIAIFGDTNSQSGFVLGAWALGSLVGGLALGHVGIAPWGLLWRIGITVVGLGLAFVSTDFWWLTAVLFLAGVGVAPSLAALFSNVSASVRFSETPEAFGWLGTGQVIGAAAGSAVAGITIDYFGGSGALGVSLVFLILTIVSAAVAIPWMPDLRHGKLGPRTESVTTIAS